jgi:hypothetical protein
MLSRAASTGGGLAPGLGQQQAALQGGQDAEGKLVGCRVGTQVAARFHGQVPPGAEGLDAVEVVDQRPLAVQGQIGLVSDDSPDQITNPLRRTCPAARSPRRQAADDNDIPRLAHERSTNLFQR